MGGKEYGGTTIVTGVVCRTAPIAPRSAEVPRQRPSAARPFGRGRVDEAPFRPTIYSRRMQPVRGNLAGGALVPAVTWFIERNGNAAASAVVSELPSQFRPLVTPHAPALGLLTARAYPYPFVGALVDTMTKVVRAKDADVFIEGLTRAGIDASLGMVMSVVLRYGVSPRGFARRAQELWDKFHDSGLVTILTNEENGYVAQVSHWPAHHAAVCKMSLYGRKRIVERTGARDVVAVREKCQAWGHDVCVARLRWR